MKHTGFYQIRDYYPNLKNPERFFGRRPLTLRSRWEITFVKNFLDVHPSVKKFCSEDVVIPYYSELDGKKHRYFIDFYMLLKDGREFLIEIKPEKFTKPPSRPKRKTKKSVRNYHMLMEEHIKNSAKWEAAEKFCDKLRREKGRDIEFKIVTERQIYG